MDREIQLMNEFTGHPDEELDLVAAITRWAEGFNAGKPRQLHVCAISEPTGPRVIFVQEVWNQ